MRNPKGVLVTEILATATVVTASELANHNTPHPKQYIAAWFVYFVLSLIAESGPDGAKLAAAFGGVTFLGVLMARGGPILNGIRSLTMEQTT